jgi:hypothetical protein
VWLVDGPDDDFGEVTKVGFHDAAGTEVVLNGDDFDAGLKHSVTQLYLSMVRQVLVTIDYRQKQKSDRKVDWQRGKNAQRELLEGTLADLDHEAHDLRGDDQHLAEAKP